MIYALLIATVVTQAYVWYGLNSYVKHLEEMLTVSNEYDRTYGGCG